MVSSKPWKSQGESLGRSSGIRRCELSRRDAEENRRSVPSQDGEASEKVPYRDPKS
ncbi:unnamed protein product [Arabis nemorensis]|uniref:Uncharacterized protein n=1 Tax=Arabis nemorensis TaxID=586526 RepID=A0A565BP23_9BRAS|nr:unnamed protein product [Arabis nemorensis]